jgi:MFS family permease
MSIRTNFDTEERKILFFASSSHFFTHFYMLAFPALVMPISRDLGLPVSEVLKISFWMYLLYGLPSMGWGWISDVWGHRWAMGSGILIAGVGMATAGLVASTAAGSYNLLSLCFAFVGVGCAAYHSAGVALVTQGTRLRGRALGIAGIWGNSGMAAVPFVIGLLNYLLGWKSSILILGVLGVFLGALTLVSPLAVKKGEDRKSVGAVDRRTATRLFVAFMVIAIFGGLMYRGFTVLLPAFLEHRLGDLAASLRRALGGADHTPGSRALDTLTANMTATFVYLSGIVGQMIGGRVADRFSLKRSYLVFFLFALPCCIAMVLLRNALLIPAAGLFALFTLGMQPVENSLVAYITPAKWRSFGYGIKTTLLFGTGSFSVWILGAVEKAHGLDWAMATISLFVVMIILSTLLFLALSRGHEMRH